jgi:hypothetical protein
MFFIHDAFTIRSFPPIPRSKMSEIDFTSRVPEVEDVIL